MARRPRASPRSASGYRREPEPSRRRPLRARKNHGTNQVLPGCSSSGPEFTLSVLRRPQERKTRPALSELPFLPNQALSRNAALGRSRPPRSRAHLGGVIPRTGSRASRHRAQYSGNCLDRRRIRRDRPSARSLRTAATPLHSKTARPPMSRSTPAGPWSGRPPAQTVRSIVSRRRTCSRAPAGHRRRRAEPGFAAVAETAATGGGEAARRASRLRSALC